MRPVIIRIFLLVSIVVASATAETAGEAGHARHSVAEGVPMLPGSVSWSPDGSRIAFIKDGVRVYDHTSQLTVKVDSGQPFFVQWLGPDKIAVLRTDDGKRILAIAELNGKPARKIPLAQEPAAVFPLRNDERRMLVLSASFQPLKFGLDVRYTVSLLDLGDDTEKTLHAFARTYQAKNIDQAQFLSWVHGGMSQLDTLLYMEHLRPPIIRAYTIVYELDPATGKVNEITGSGRERLYFSGSWSPDASRVALTTASGGFRVVDSGGNESFDSWDLRGWYPSWNPRGSQIYIGGLIVTPDGKKLEEIVKAGEESLGVWSPDGTRLAVLSGSGLELVEGFVPSLLPPDRVLVPDQIKRISTLKQLLRDGLITMDEYRQRRDRVRGEAVTTP